MCKVILGSGGGSNLRDTLSRHWEDANRIRGEMSVVVVFLFHDQSRHHAECLDNQMFKNNNNKIKIGRSPMSII